MAPMYDEDEDIWTGAGLSRDIARRRLADQSNLPSGPSGGDRALGAVKGALSGAGTGAALGSIIPGVGNAIGAGVGALVGGVGGAVTASPKETMPSAGQIASGVGALKGAYDQYGHDLGDSGLLSKSSLKNVEDNKKNLEEQVFGQSMKPKTYSPLSFEKNEDDTGGLHL